MLLARLAAAADDDDEDTLCQKYALQPPQLFRQVTKNKLIQSLLKV